MPTIRINNHPVGLMRQGAGQPVLLLHGSGSTSAQWRALADSLSTRFLVLAPDLYGWGDTAPWPGHRDFALEDETALLHALLDSLDQPTHVVGHSYGAAVALHLARTRVGGLRSLSLIEPVAFHLLREGDETDLLALDEFLDVGDTMMRAMCRGDLMGSNRCFIDYWNGPGAWARVPEAKRAAMAAGLSSVISAFHAITTDPTRMKDVSCVAVPTLLVQGSRTTLPAQRVCKRLALAWPQANFKVIPGAGHMSPITHRDQVNALIAMHIEANAVVCSEAAPSSV
jgi:pimeloyl-ACP methyl ester carboxylesterase